MRAKRVGEATERGVESGDVSILSPMPCPESRTREGLQGARGLYPGVNRKVVHLHAACDAFWQLEREA